MTRKLPNIVFTHLESVNTVSFLTLPVPIYNIHVRAEQNVTY